MLPSPENVLAGTYNPLSRPLFIYVSRKSMDKPAVKEFVEFYLKNVGVWRKKLSTCRFLKRLPNGHGASSHICKQEQVSGEFPKLACR